MNPDVDYVRAHVDGEQLIMAASLVERVLGEGVDTEPAGEIVGLSYEPPFPYVTDFGERSHTVLPADFVTTDDGTGIVHTALAFGEDDFALGERFGMTLQNPVKPDGTFDERIEPFAGRGVREAGADIVEALRESGRLYRAEDYEHSYPHCWRCGTPLIYYAKSSWYVRTTDRREELLASNEAVTWHPEHIKHGRFGKWLENNVDWALSRERYWGTPLPIWRSEDGEEAVCVGSVAELRELGADVPDDLHRPYIDDATFERDGKTFRRVPELIDVWWDSGCMPFAQSGDRNAPPADYICEGLDQTRGWFYSMLAVSTLLFGRASYETVLCLGLIVDPEGQKMSKSKGNVVVAVGGDRRPRRRCLPLVLLHLEAAVGRLPLLARDGRRVGAPVHAHALEHLRLLRPVRERQRRRARRPRGSPTSTAGPCRACALGHRGRNRAPGGLRHHDRRPRGGRVRGRALQLVRAALAPALLGRRPGGVLDAAHLPGHRCPSCWRR